MMVFPSISIDIEVFIFNFICYVLKGKAFEMQLAVRGALEMMGIPGYKLISCLDEGISSNIYRATCLSNNQPVIIKVSTQKELSEKKTHRF